MCELWKVFETLPATAQQIAVKRSEINFQGCRRFTRVINYHFFDLLDWRIDGNKLVKQLKHDLAKLSRGHNVHYDCFTRDNIPIHHVPFNQKVALVA